jgi:hypothetical protein
MTWEEGHGEIYSEGLRKRYFLFGSFLSPAFAGIFE